MGPDRVAVPGFVPLRADHAHGEVGCPVKLPQGHSDDSKHDDVMRDCKLLGGILHCQDKLSLQGDVHCGTLPPSAAKQSLCCDNVVGGFAGD